MEERINDIVSQEAIEQLQKLGEMLEQNTVKMTELIKATNEYRLAMDRADGAKEVSTAVTSLNDSTTKLVNTQSERLNIEREIKTEGDKMRRVLESEKNLWEAVGRALQKVNKDMGELVYSLINNKAELSNTQSQLKKYRKELESLKADLKEGAISQKMYDKESDKLLEKMDRLIAVEQRLKQDISEQEIALKNHAKAANTAAGSYDAMSAQLGQLRDTYRQLSAEERNDPMIGGVLLQGINQLDEELKALDKTMGNNQRNVGNYEISAKTIRTELMNCRNALMELNMNTKVYSEEITKQQALLQNLASTHGESSSEYASAKARLDELVQKQQEAEQQLQTLREKTAELTAEQKKNNAQVEMMANPNAGMDALASVVGDVVQAFAGYKSIMLAVGVENEDAEKVIAKLVAIQQVANSVQAISNSLLSKNGTIRKVQAALDKFSIAYKKQLAAAEAKHAAATAAQGVAATTATTANKGLASSFRAVGVAIKTIPGVGWILALVAALVAAGAAIKKMHENAKQKGIEEMNKQLGKTKQLLDDLDRSWGFEERLLQAQGASEEMIWNRRFDYLQAKNKEASKELEIARKNYALGKATKEQYEEALGLYKESSRALDDYFMEKTINDTQKATNEYNRRQREATEAANKAAEDKKKAAEEELKFSQEIAKQLEDMQAKDEASRFNLGIKRLQEEKEILKAKYNDNKILVDNIEKYYNLKIKNLGDEFASNMVTSAAENAKEAIDDAWASLDASQKDEINKKIIEKGGALSDEENMDLVLKQLQDRIDKLKELEKEYLKAGMTEAEYTRLVNEYTAQQVEASEKAKNAKEEKVKASNEALRQSYFDLAGAIGGAFISIGDAIADGMTNQVQQVKLQQALAMAQLLLSQGVSLANAIEAGTKEGASKGSVVAMYAAIATAVGTVIAQIITAKNAIDQAKTAMSQAEAYAEGTDYHHGGAALVGEGEYPELVMAGGKNFVVDKPTFFKSLPVGAKVIPITPDMSRNVDLSVLEDGVRRLNDKSTVNINVGENVYAYIVKGANRARMLNKSFIH